MPLNGTPIEPTLQEIQDAYNNREPLSLGGGFHRNAEINVGSEKVFYRKTRQPWTCFTEFRKWEVCDHGAEGVAGLLPSSGRVVGASVKLVLRRPQEYGDAFRIDRLYRFI